MHTILTKFKYINRFIINNTDGKIEITRNPNQFINDTNNANNVVYSPEDSISDTHFIELLLIELSKYNYQLDGRSSISNKLYSMFPDPLSKKNISKKMLGTDNYIESIKAQFSNMYINADFTIRNSNLFKNKIVGSVSFFNEISGIDEKTGADLFPTKIT